MKGIISFKMDDSVVKFEEKIIFNLRSLYKKYGYLPYNMSKFEEYELYAGNKEFLVSDRVITFNDTNGRLMALKPDVTLSIIKNGEDAKGIKQKVFYDENVYRVSESTNRFKEILQMGLECIGDIDIYDIYEVITLAAESLSGISENFYIEVSNLDIVCRVVSGICSNSEFIQEVNRLLAQKNTHDLKKICDSFSVDENGYKKIAGLASLYGDRDDCLSKLEGICGDSATSQMKLLSSLLDKSRYSSKIKFDFSLIDDINYYNGFVFRGYIDGMYCSVLAGGQYGKMMKKMNRSCEACGFALYLDKLGELNRERKQYDVDYLLLYDENTDIEKITNTVNEITGTGHSVNAQKAIPPKLRYGQILDLR